MQILAVNKNILELLPGFIQPYEHTCASLAAQIRKNPKDVFILTSVQNPTQIQHIWGVFSFDGTILHCFPYCKQKNDLNFQAYAVLKDFFITQNVKCINGEEAGSLFLLNILKELNHNPFQTNNYILMTLQTPPVNPPEALYNDDEIKRCQLNDLDLLFDLQKKYLIEEVSPVNKEVSDLACSVSLKQILKNQLCYALYSNGEIVAKANTNAIGYNWIQLGGIYTHPLYRRNYYAWHLINLICKKTFRANKKVVLFVKTHNNNARLLYTKIGFAQNEAYTISYF